MGDPTARQIRYLKSLGYEGDSPPSIDHASAAIDVLKGGGSHDDIKRAWDAVDRDLARELVDSFRSEMAGIAEDERAQFGRKDDPTRTAGVVLEDRSPEGRFDGAYLSLRDARRASKHLPLADIEWEEVTREQWPSPERARKPYKLVTPDGDVQLVKPKRGGGCGNSLAWAVFWLALLGAVIWSLA